MDIEVNNLKSCEKISFKDIPDVDAAKILVMQEILEYLKIIARKE